MKSNLNFFELNLAKTPVEKQLTFLASPLLKDYKHFLEIIFESAKFNLSEEEENILMLKSRGSEQNWSLLLDEHLQSETPAITIDQKTEEKNLEELLTLSSNKDESIRNQAILAIRAILAKHSKTATWELNSILESSKIEESLRKSEELYATVAASHDVSTKVIHAVQKAVSESFDISKRFYDLKCKLLNVQNLKYEERNIEFSLPGSKELEYSFDDSVDFLIETFELIHPKFSNILKSFIEDGRIDAQARKGKTSGAYCTFGSRSQQPFILLNHCNKIGDVSTMAHEIGHGINHTLMLEKQTNLNFGTSIFAAEIASTFFENFVFNRLLQGVDKVTSFNYRFQKLQDDISTVFRQMACFNFETFLHTEYRSNGFLSTETLQSKFKEYMKQYLGESIDVNDAGNFWVYWSHLRYHFYVYSYTTGNLISSALFNKYKNDPSFIDSIFEIFSVGSKKKIVDVFNQVGIDIESSEFWLSGIESIKNDLIQLEKEYVELKI